MTAPAIAIPSAMRLAFERAWAEAARPYSGLGRLVKSALRKRNGVTYRRRLWSVERARKR